MIHIYRFSIILGLIILTGMGVYQILNKGIKMCIPIYSFIWITKKEWKIILIGGILLFFGAVGEFYLID